MIDYLFLEGITNDPCKVETYLPKFSRIKDSDSEAIHETIKGTTKEVVTLQGNRIKLSGSLLHKAYNLQKWERYENVSPATYSELQNQLDYLVEKYDLDEEQTKINSIEFSANCRSGFKVPHQVLGLIEGLSGKNGKMYRFNTMFHNDKHFQLIRKKKGYRFTAYDKGYGRYIDKDTRKYAKQTGLIRFELKASFKKNGRFNVFPHTLKCLRDKEVHRQAILLLRDFVERLQFRNDYEDLLPKFKLAANTDSHKAGTALRGSPLVSFVLLKSLVKDNTSIEAYEAELEELLKAHSVTRNVRTAAMLSLRAIIKQYRQMISDIPVLSQEHLLINFDYEMAHYLEEKVNHPGYIGELIRHYEADQEG